MISPDVNRTLNRLLISLYRSLPMYLRDAVPWLDRGKEETQQTLTLIVEDQQNMVDRIGEMILDGDGEVRFGGFPMVFAAWHDLSFDFLLLQMVTYQQRLITDIEACAEALRLNPTAQALALEALGEAKAHLESLQELVAKDTRAVGS